MIAPSIMADCLAHGQLPTIQRLIKTSFKKFAKADSGYLGAGTVGAARFALSRTSISCGPVESSMMLITSGENYNLIKLRNERAARRAPDKKITERAARIFEIFAKSLLFTIRAEAQKKLVHASCMNHGAVARTISRE